MKRTIISLFAAGLLASVASAQLNFGPVVSVAGNSSEGTGVAVSGTLWFSTVGDVGTLTYRINNLSGTGSYTPGELSAFSIGFNTDDFTYQMGSFAVLNGGDSFLLADVTMTDAIDFDEGEGTGPGAYYLDVSAHAASSGSGGGDTLLGGYWAEFEFKFDIAEGATFDPNGFFLTTSAYDLTWRFQTVGTGGQDSDFLGLDLGEDPGGGGSGFVPEPSTYGMFGALALLGLMVVRQLRRR
jgi:hypothetical protein